MKQEEECSTIKIPQPNAWWKTTNPLMHIIFMGEVINVRGHLSAFIMINYNIIQEYNSNPRRKKPRKQWRILRRRKQNRNYKIIHK